MYSPFRYLGSTIRKRRPIHLTFFVTRKCNARCPFCFYIKNATEQATDTKELSLQEIRKISLSMDKLLWLAFSGGEVFLRKDIVAISQIFYAQNKPSIMLYPTNGHLPDLIYARIEEILKNCSHSIVVVKLSMDGLYDDHDTLRDTPGSFKKVLKTYHLLGELLGRYPNFELGINTLFCAGNQDKMDEIIDFVKGLEHINTHTISLVRGNLLYPQYKQVDHRMYHHAIKRLQENIKNKTSRTYRFKGATLKAAQDNLQRQFIYQTMQQQERQIPCYAGRLNLVMTESGEIYPCEILSTSFGNIKDFNYDMEEVIQSERAESVLGTINKNQCFCTHECNFITNILFNPRLYPALAKEYLQLLTNHPGRANVPPLRTRL